MDTWTGEQEHDVPLWVVVLLLLALGALLILAARVGADRQCAWLRTHNPVTYHQTCEG